MTREISSNNEQKNSADKTYRANDEQIAEKVNINTPQKKKRSHIR